MTSGAFKDMSSRLGFVMAEHPAWQPTDAGCRRVFALADGGRYLLVVRGHELVSHALAAGNSEPCLDTFTLPRAVLSEVPELATALSSLGPVVRFRNADLWDAIGTGIIRQVIRAGQAKKLYRAFCEAYGERVELPNGETYALFPSPETVMGLETDQFVSIGMAFKRRPLKSAAEVYLEQGARWRQLSPVALMAALQEVPRIGPWTAHATVADWSNDWALYSYADLAVRTWATRAAPSHHWPTEEAAFGRAWRTLAGDHLCSVTLLTLAWGSQHGDIG
jgi:DNA-3-methyladenine glycosylase II